MAEAAEQLEPDQPDNIVPLPVAADPSLSVSRKAEGGLSLRFQFDIPKLPVLDSAGSWTHQQMLNAVLIAAVAVLAGWTVYQARFGGDEAVPPVVAEATNLRPNVATTFNPDIESPTLGPGTYVDHLASVIGNVTIGKDVFVAPFASIRGDEGQPLLIGDGSNVQDGVVLHALETLSDGKSVDKNLVTVGGKKYAVYVGKGVSLAHQSQVHGPASIGDHTFVGMQALVFKSTVGKNVVIEPGAKVIGVNIVDGRYVPAGSVVTSQAQADALPLITPDYAFATLNDGVLHVNEAFADAYLRLDGAEAAHGGEAAAPAGH